MSIKKLDFEEWEQFASKSESVEIEVSLESFKQAQAHQQLVDASVKILNYLKEKRRLYNLESTNKISLEELKQIFFNSERNYVKNNDLELSVWGLASVDAQLKNLENETIPTDEDIKKAQEVAVAKNISVKLNSLEELYIEAHDKLKFDFLY